MGSSGSAHRGEPERGQAGGSWDLVDFLRELAALRDRDVLSEAEFQRARVMVVAEQRAALASR